ncbi:NADP-dependent oxidoreductase [Kitasatospora sp. NPDC002227]|uniref:NADP-dependent oxidoreductase n=1 Tax=Kitasatospora sp. NPDC002227 TaxID=3154773 RepID=UPI00332ADAFB
MPGTARYIHQIARPAGLPRPTDFAFLEAPLPAVAPGTALVENIYLSVDPYMRQRMNEGLSELHTPIEGRSIGRVVESRAPELRPGDLVFHREGWRTHALVRPAEARVLPRYEGVPLSAFLSVLGGTGLTAYVGLTKIARLQPGERVFVSAAAGGVGSAAGQIARLLGAEQVIGSAGSAAKVKRLTERLGYHDAFDYHDGPVGELLRRAAPEGIDVYFDNVGGDHLAGAIDVLRDHGRIAWCGGVSQYNEAAPTHRPANLFEVVHKSLRLEGFLVSDHRHVQAELENFLVPYLRSGELVADETVATGFDRVAEAFIGLLQGENLGKMIVQVGEV